MDDSRPSAGPPLAPSVARNIGVTIVGSLFPPFAALLSAPILAQALGVAGRGEVSAATAPFLLATTVATLGIPEAITYSVARDPRVARYVVGRGLAILSLVGVLATGVLVGISNWLAAGDNKLAALIVLASLMVIPGLFVGCIRAVATGIHRWDLVARERIVVSLLRLSAFAVLSGLGNLSPLTATLVIVLSPVLGALPYLKIRCAFRRSPKSNATELRLVDYGFRVWIGSLAGILLARVDQFIMTPLAGVEELGLYVVAVNIGDVGLIIGSAVREVSFSSDAADRNNERLMSGARIALFATFVVAVGLGASLDRWVPTVFGEDFVSAIQPARVLLLAAVLGLPGSIAGVALSARGNPGLRSLGLTLASAANLVTLLLLVPRMGAMGAAVAMLVGNVIAGATNIVFLSRRQPEIKFTGYLGLRRRDIERLKRILAEVR